MKFKLKKIFGWILLITGLLIIGWSLYSTYNIFTGKAPAPEVFVAPAPATGLPNQGLGFQEEVKKMVEQEIKEMIPSEFLSRLFNLISWSILAGILIFGGSKISGVGIKLIKACE